jgi:hypothetical protein
MKRLPHFAACRTVTLPADPRERAWVLAVAAARVAVLERRVETAEQGRLGEGAQS